MPEMVQTFKSMQKTESEKRKFLASIQGVEIRRSRLSKMLEEKHLESTHQQMILLDYKEHLPAKLDSALEQD
jgi:hypothetical protein